MYGLDSSIKSACQPSKLAPSQAATVETPLSLQMQKTKHPFTFHSDLSIFALGMRSWRLVHWLFIHPLVRQQHCGFNETYCWGASVFWSTRACTGAENGKGKDRHLWARPRFVVGLSSFEPLYGFRIEYKTRITPSPGFASIVYPIEKSASRRGEQGEAF